MFDVRSFQDRTVVVTGGARGIGAEIVRRFVGLGGHALACDMREDEGRELCAELGERCEFFKLDVTKTEDWDRLRERIEAHGRLDGIVNNAGIFDPRTIDRTDASFFSGHMEVNQLGVFLGIRFASELASQAGMSIVNMSSISGLRGQGGIAYVGTKWAVRGMTKLAAKELGPRGIRVNSVHPGLIDTQMIEAIAPEILEQRSAMIPLGRLGTQGDIAEAVMFLLSDSSRYINGAELAVDGGLSV